MPITSSPTRLAMYPIHYLFEMPSSASRSPPWCLKWLSAPEAEEVFNTTGTETQF